MRKTPSVVLVVLGAALVLVAAASLAEGIATSDLLALPASLPRLGFIVVLTVLGFRCVLGARHQQFTLGARPWVLALLSGVILLAAAWILAWLFVAV